MKKIDLLSLIYKAYIFFIPFSMFSFVDLDNVLVKYFFFSISCFFLYIGLAIIFIKSGKLVLSPLMTKLVKIYLYMTVFSLIAAIVLYVPLGTKYGENTFDCIQGDIVFYFVVLINIYFNQYCLGNCVNLKELEKVLWIDVLILLLLGFLQFFVIAGVGPAHIIYHTLSNVFNLYSYDNLSSGSIGITFFGSELSAASSLFINIVPFLLSKTLFYENKKEKYKAIVCLLLFSFLFLNTSSSSVYISLLFILTTYLIVIMGKNLYWVIILLGILVGCGTVIIYGTGIVSQLIHVFPRDTLGYIILGKVFDVSNLSTAMRFSGMGMFIYIFTHFPFTGVGNGIQGYFYENGLQEWAYDSSEVQNVLLGNVGISNGGGAFYTAYITGYGLIGVVILVYFIKKVRKVLQNKKLNIKWLYFAFLFGFAIFNFEAWTVMGIKQNLHVMFMLSIPFIAEKTSDRLWDKEIYR